MRRTALAAAFAVLSATLAATSAHAQAPTIVYDSSASSTGVYVYDLDANVEGFTFNSGGSITFTGLVGVTGATTAVIPGGLNFSTSYTSTSVTFTDHGFSYTVPAGQVFTDLLTIDSTASPGTVNYASDGNSPDISGTVEGPAIAPTPEPSSIALLATGLLGVAAVLRKRLA